MTKKQFREALAVLGLTRQEFAQVSGKSLRSVQGYATGQEIPLLVERFVEVLIRTKYPIGKWF